jgi:hypothetical protein
MKTPTSELAAVANQTIAANQAVVANQTVVLSNLAYLIGAVLLAAVIITVVAIRNHRPRSTEADMNEFRRGLAALNPNRDDRTRRGANRSRRTANRLGVPTRLESPGVLVRPGTAGLTVGADGTAPRRPSTRSEAG